MSIIKSPAYVAGDAMHYSIVYKSTRRRCAPCAAPLCSAAFFPHPSNTPVKISALARASATSADAIRYYEKLGLLPAPLRTCAGWREYGEAHAERLALIRQARALGMSLSEVRALLACFDQSCADCAAAHALIDEHLGHIGERIRQLRALERQLRTLRARCDGHCEGARCAIVRGMAEQAAAGAPPAPVDGVHPHAPPA